MFISIKNANQNNLNNVDIDIPYHKIVAVLGPSGSGKSSLFFDVLYKYTRDRYCRCDSNKNAFIKVGSIKNITPIFTIRSLLKINNINIAKLINVEECFKQWFSNIARTEVMSPDKIFDQVINTIKFASDDILSIVAIIKQTSANAIMDMGFEKIISDNDNILHIEDLSDAEKREVGDYRVVVDRFIGSNIDRNRFIDSCANAVNNICFSRMYIACNDAEQKSFTRKDFTYTDLFSKHTICSACKRTNLSCDVCNGLGYFSDAIVNNKFHGKNLIEIFAMPIKDLAQLCKGGDNVAIDRLYKIFSRLEAMHLGHVSLNNITNDISDGEFKRIIVGYELHDIIEDTMYIFDEISVGLDKEDICQFIYPIIDEIIANNSSVVLIDHDTNMIKKANYFIELGPGAGIYGGQVIDFGDINADSIKNSASLRYAYGMDNIVRSYKSISSKLIELSDCNFLHLKDLHATLYLNALNIISGRSGTGKSLFLKLLAATLGGTEKHKEKISYSRIYKSEAVKKVVFCDYLSSKENFNNKSIVATYSDIFDSIRKMFASIKDSLVHDYNIGHFSFNSKLGMCNACSGSGSMGNDMTCDTCNGSRYNSAVLKIKYKGYSIVDVLNMNIQQVYSVFCNIPFIYKKCHTLIKIGLAHLKMNDNVKNLSIGEFRRLTIAKHTYNITKDTVFLLDSPAYGLHHKDISMMMDFLDTIISNGNTIVMSTNVYEISAIGDWVINIDCGRVLFEGVGCHFKELYL